MREPDEEKYLLKMMNGETPAVPTKHRSAPSIGEMRRTRREELLVSITPPNLTGYKKDPEARAVPGANSPCPCGSGKKYKKCHKAWVERQVAEIK